MKIGMRKPSLTRSLKARTTSKWKRQAKKPLSLAMVRKGWDGLKIQRKPCITRFIIRQPLDFQICLNHPKRERRKWSTTNSNLFLPRTAKSNTLQKNIKKLGLSLCF